MSSEEQPEFISLIKGNVYNVISKFILNNSIHNYSEFYYIINLLFKIISESNFIEKTHILNYINFKILDLPQFEQRNTITIENNNPLPVNFVFTNCFLSENLEVIKKFITPKVTNLNDVKICLNTIFRYIKNQSYIIEYRSLHETLIKFNSNKFSEDSTNSESNDFEMVRN
jgi:hypothetical protein